MKGIIIFKIERLFWVTIEEHTIGEINCMHADDQIIEEHISIV